MESADQYNIHPINARTRNEVLYISQISVTYGQLGHRRSTLET